MTATSARDTTEPRRTPAGQAPGDSSREASGASGASDGGGDRAAGDDTTELGSREARRPLAITADDDLLDELVRIAEGVGVSLQVVPDAAAARTPWQTASLVLLGGDLAGPVARGRFAHRSGLLLVVRQRLEQIDEQLWKDALRAGVQDVLALPEHEARLAERLGEASCGVAEPGRPAHLACVIGGRGGSGASALSATLASIAHGDGVRSLLIDGDPVGGGIDLVVGGEDAAGMRWNELAMVPGRIGPRGLVDALPSPGGFPVLSFGRGERSGPEQVPAHAVRNVLAAARRACELLVVDLPRQLDDAARAVLAEADSVLLVVPLELRAVAAARQVSRIVRERAPAAARFSMVARGPAPGGLAAPEVSDVVGVPLVGALPSEQGMAARLERGEVPARANGSLVRFCRSYVRELELFAGRAV